MMIARGREGENMILFLGLSAESVRRLQLGQPIRITRETHGDGIPDGWTIGILYGPTEAHLEKMIAPFCDDTTYTFRDPRL